MRRLALLCLIPLLIGCSPVMAARQPDAKDLGVLAGGVPRAQVIAELGAPVWSETKDGVKTDIFAFTQGYSTGAKVSRTIVHAVFDVFTLGLWEVVGTPIEAIASGTKTKIQVTYDEQDRVKTVTKIEGD